MAMEEFEKWYNKEIKPHLPKNKSGPGIGTAEVFREAREETWRAALEWARDNAGGESSDSRAVYGDIVKELGDT